MQQSQLNRGRGYPPFISFLATAYSAHLDSPSFWLSPHLSGLPTYLSVSVCCHEAFQSMRVADVFMWFSMQLFCLAG